MQTSGKWLGYLFSLLVLTASSACSDRAQTAGSGEPDLGMLGTQVAELSGGETHERCDTLPADLVWTGGTDIQNGGRTNRDRNVGYLRIARSTGTYRPAAISGSVTFRSANILGTQYSHAILANYTSFEVIHLQRPN